MLFLRSHVAFKSDFLFVWGRWEQRTCQSFVSLFSDYNKNIPILVYKPEQLE